MAKSERSTVGERLYWCYANQAMAEMATTDRAEAYGRLHYMVRARLYKGLRTGSMSAGSLMRDQAVRMKLPQECVYCGSVQFLSIDHIVPVNRGGDDGGDNAIWACRRCNSSKSDRDLFEWWSATRGGLPPLFVVRIYMKQALRYFENRGLLGQDWRTVEGSAYDLAMLPESFPGPRELTFTPHHARKRRAAETEAESTGEGPDAGPAAGGEAAGTAAE
ncbi:MAG: HNH endonuclease [Planctomycetes bacterium]|nr:HNH endonuclease [Planctomycetota bacterium]